jgi:RNA polymerase sigma-70 factor (ECF subfamily)
MSSEAAYFPDSLARIPAPPEQACCAPDDSSKPFGLEQSACNVPERHAGPIASACEVADELLLERIKMGVEDALSLLFRRHAHVVRNVAYRILRDEAEADDLVQEVFLFIFRKAGLYDSRHGKAITWIIHVAYHRAFDRRRYLNTRHFYASQELDDTSLRLADKRKEIGFHEQSMEGILGKHLMARFNSRLSLEQRETIRLFFFEGYSFKEISDLTGRPLANVRNHYYRGLERMRKYVLLERMRSA